MMEKVKLAAAPPQTTVRRASGPQGAGATVPGIYSFSLKLSRRRTSRLASRLSESYRSTRYNFASGPS